MNFKKAATHFILMIKPNETLIPRLCYINEHEISKKKTINKKDWMNSVNLKIKFFWTGKHSVSITRIEIARY